MIFNCMAVIVKKLIGIELEKRTDLISFVALMLSILAVAWSIYGFLKGAKVNIYLDDQVLITKEDCGRGDGVKCLRLGTTVAFSNSGEIGYDAVIKKIVIALKFLDGAEYEQEWYEFVTFRKNENNNQLKKKDPVASAVPLQISAQNALSRDIYFTPFRKRCAAGETGCDEWHNYITWKDFLKKLKVGQNIEVTIIAQSLDNKILEKKSCKVDIDQHLIRMLNNPGWQSPSCWPLE